MKRRTEPASPAGERRDELCAGYWPKVVCGAKCVASECGAQTSSHRRRNEYGHDVRNTSQM